MAILIAAATLITAFAAGERTSPARSFSQLESPSYSLSPETAGMFSSGASYAYDLSDVGVVPIEDFVTEVQHFLSSANMPDLKLIDLREFQFAYQVEIAKRNTGRHAFGFMIAKGTRQLPPKAGPYIFGNTNYGPMIAEVGGGYGMVGRLPAEGAPSEMPVSESSTRELA